jgi:hypothetical protein
MKQPEWLNEVITGRQEAPLKLAVYGPEGHGKSTFVSDAPHPIFASLDDRLNHLDVARRKIRTWDGLMMFARDLEEGGHPFKTAVFDPINWAEPMLYTLITGSALGNIQKWDGGYGRGTAAAMSHWRAFVAQLERLREKGMNIILVAHSAVRTVNPPDGSSYDVYDIALEKSAAGLIRQWADHILFARVETIAKADKGERKARAVMTDRRIVNCQPCGSWYAKISGADADELPMVWDEFIGALKSGKERAESLIAQLRELAKGTEYEAKTKEVIAAAKGNPDRLAVALSALRGRLEPKQEQ